MYRAQLPVAVTAPVITLSLTVPARYRDSAALSQRCCTRIQQPHQLRDQIEEKQKAYCVSRKSGVLCFQSFRWLLENLTRTLKNSTKKRQNALYVSRINTEEHIKPVPRFLLGDYSMLVGSASAIWRPTEPPTNSVTNHHGVLV